MEGEILKGHLDMIVLAALDASPAHGYAIIQEIRRRSGGAFDLPEGTIYPVLHRLEEAGLLASRWVEHAGERKRRVYSLTRKGTRSLTGHRDQWQRFADAIGNFVGNPAHVVSESRR